MNKNLKRNLGIIALSLIGGVAISAGALGMHKASAETAFDTANIQMIKGASVRYYSNATTDADSGIRFSAAIKSSEYEALEAMESETVKVSYGMLIAPYEYYGENNEREFNAATVFGIGGEKKYTWDGETVEEGATYTKIVNITYDTLIASTKEGYTDCHEIKGSLVKIKEENLTKEFIGRGYVKYETTEGVSYKFADYFDTTVENNARSIVYVSQLAIEAGDDAAEWVKQHYVDKVAEEKTTYTIAIYVGDEWVKNEYEEATVNADLENAPIREYQGYTNVSAETSGKVYANGKLTLKHVYAENEGTPYQVTNGGFEDGIDGWTPTGNIGAVSSEKNYWIGDEANADGFPFGLDGTYMFSAYATEGLEGNKGVLKSSTFTVSESGWITYKLGGAKNLEYVHLDIVESSSGKILKRYHNQNHRYELVDGVRLGCELNAYKADLTDCVGKEVYLRISDYASSDFGLFFLDSVDTLHLAEPNDTYTLATVGLHEETIYDLFNGNFDHGMYGWTKDSNIGDISEDTTYWAEAKPYDNVGKFFSCYAPDQSEGSMGTLRSNVFEVGGSGYITYRIGGVKNPDQVYMEVIDAITGVKYGHFYNEFMADCTLINYKADLSAYIGKLVYINFVDKATGDYGLIFCDEFVTYYADATTVPEEYNVAVNKVESIYNVMNGGFETGNLLGWTLVSGDVPGRVTDIDYFWNDASRVIGKDGNFSFTGVELNPDNGNLEGLMGTLRSNTFVLKANSSISFKMGGSGADRQDVCLRIVNAATGEVVVWYSNPDFRDATLNAYDKEIGNASEMVCYVEIVDNATSNWGLLGLDSINVYQK
ncbi:MAG: hypothetical protein IJ308_05320 [Clostridia bacterium]|nr:hypothetical protein [Clostridia bacterium]